VYKILKDNNLSVSNFAKFIDISKDVVYKYLKDNNSVSESSRQIIEHYYKALYYKELIVRKTGLSKEICMNYIIDRSLLTESTKIFLHNYIENEL
jgi:predicted transcriptional regulator